MNKLLKKITAFMVAVGLVFSPQTVSAESEMPIDKIQTLDKEDVDKKLLDCKIVFEDESKESKIISTKTIQEAIEKAKEFGSNKILVLLPKEYVLTETVDFSGMDVRIASKGVNGERSKVIISIEEKYMDSNSPFMSYGELPSRLEIKGVDIYNSIYALVFSHNYTNTYVVLEDVNTNYGDIYGVKYVEATKYTTEKECLFVHDDYIKCSDSSFEYINPIDVGNCEIIGGVADSIIYYHEDSKNDKNKNETNLLIDSTNTKYVSIYGANQVELANIDDFHFVLEDSDNASIINCNLYNSHIKNVNSATINSSSINDYYTESDSNVFLNNVEISSSMMSMEGARSYLSGRGCTYIGDSSSQSTTIRCGHSIVSFPFDAQESNPFSISSHDNILDKLVTFNHDKTGRLYDEKWVHPNTKIYKNQKFKPNYTPSAPDNSR